MALCRSPPLCCLCLCHCADHRHSAVSACATVPIMATLLSLLVPLCQSWPLCCLCLCHCADHRHSAVSACATVPIMATLLSLLVPLCQSWPLCCLCLCHCANHGHSAVSACVTVPVMATLLSRLVSLCRSPSLSCLCLATLLSRLVALCRWKVGCCCSEHISAGKRSHKHCNQDLNRLQQSLSPGMRINTRGTSSQKDAPSVAGITLYFRHFQCYFYTSISFIYPQFHL